MSLKNKNAHRRQARCANVVPNNEHIIPRSVEFGWAISAIAGMAFVLLCELGVL